MIITNILDNAVKNFGNKAYVANKTSKGWEEVTFAQAKETAEYIASFLLTQGCKKEDNYVILSEGKASWVISEIAIIVAGAVSVPLSIKLQTEEIPFRLNHSEAKGIFVSKNYIEKVFSISSQFENKNLEYYYLDEDVEFAKKLALKHNISTEKIFSYNEIIEIGKSKFEENKQVLEYIKNNQKLDDTVTISYTSGTTGNPKGIMLTHKNYWVNCNDAINVFEVPQNFKTLLILPCDHSFAHTVGIFTGLIKGITLYFVDSRGGGMNTLKNIPINLKEIQSDFLLTVPALSGNFMNKIKDGVSKKGGLINGIFNSGLNAGIKINKNGFSKAGILTKLANYPIYFLAKKLIFSKLKEIWGGNINYFVGGGALLDISQQEFFYSIGIPVFQGYGLTEASPIISANSPMEHKLGTSGKVFPSIQCKIVDDNETEVATGIKGQIIIKGDSVMKGYYKNPNETAVTIKNEWLFTGDLGYLDEDDFLVVTGREKALLISDDGEKYSPEEIEEAIVNTSDIIDQVMLYNDHKKITTSLITLNTEKIKKLINDKNITKSEDLISEITTSIYNFKSHNSYKGKFPEKWIPSTYRIMEEPFSEQNKMINSTMKMVRHNIVEKYNADIEYMYAKGNKPNNETNNKILNNLYKLN